MARRRPNRLARPVAGHTIKGLPAGLAQPGGQVRSSEQIAALVAQQMTVGGLAQPLPRDQFPYAFGPGMPLTPAPLDPTRPTTGRAEPRLWEYPVSWNLPGVTTGRTVPWRILRQAAEIPLIRDCIRIRKAEVAGLEWDFSLSRRAVERAQRDQPGASRLDVESGLRQKLAGEIDRAVSFWTAPDKGNGYTFTEWISQALEEHLVLDALAIYPRRTLGGDLYALEVLDGSTVKPLLDHRGGRPMPPEAAYQQIIHGFPRGEYTADTSDTNGQTVVTDGYTADQLIYIRREVRTHTPYGLSPVESALIDIDLWQKRVGWLRSEYTDGMAPSGWLRWLSESSNTWTPQQIAEYERELNDHYAGNTALRRRYRVLPPGLIPDESNASEAERYKPEFDLFVIKLVAAHFDITAHELGHAETKGIGGAGHAEGQDRLGERKGRGPALKWIASLISDMSRAHLGTPPELEFRWLGLDDETEDAEQTRADVASGLLTLNEGRDEIGRPRYAFPEADRAAIMSTAGTVTFIEGAEQRAAAAAELAARAAVQPPPAPGQAPPVDEQQQAKTAEAAAYRRWAAKGHSSRRFELQHLVHADLAVHGVDPDRVLVKADEPTTFTLQVGSVDGSAMSAAIAELAREGKLKITADQVKAGGQGKAPGPDGPATRP